MDKLKSRKFWLALAGTVLPIIASYLTGDVDLYESLRLSAAVVISYVLGQGYVDGQAASALKG